MSNAASSNVAAAVTWTQLLAGNPSRKGATIYNNSSAVLHLSFNPPATAISTDSIAADLAAETAGVLGGYYEVPFGYTGPVYGLWEAAAGKANINDCN